MNLLPFESQRPEGDIPDHDFSPDGNHPKICAICHCADSKHPSPKFIVCVSVGGVVQFYQLTRAEIDDAWRTIQASALPQTFVGWYDERDKWTQLGTKPAKF